MKTITISTENSETYSSISNFFIDYYMTEANGEFVKVYLYLVRLLNSRQAVTVASIADHFNLTENDICRAIKYWISRDVLKLNYDGNGRLSGIVLLPLYAPNMMGLKMETDAVSILNNNTKDVSPKEETVPHLTLVADNSTPSSEERTAPAKPSFSKQELVDAFKDSNLEDIQYLIETLFKLPITQSRNATILYIYDTLEFDADLFEYLIEYCVEMGKTNFRYMEAVAIAWYKDGITTRQQAKERSVIATGIAKTIFKALGIRCRIPTDTEIAFIKTWTKDFGFNEEIIKKACDKAILAQPGSANFAYVNAILDNWNKNNVKTLADIDKLDKAFVYKTSAKNTQTGNNYRPKDFNNFEQTKLDKELAEMEELFLREVNSK